jgi:hypothetical protein
MKNLPLFSLLLVSVVSFSQVGIGTSSPAPSAQLDVTTTTKGFLPPRMTTVQRDAIVSPATGLQVYNTTTNTNDYYNGTAWISGSSGAGITPIFYAYTNVAQTFPALDLTKIVNFGTVVTDNVGGFNTATNKYTVVTTGYYQVEAALQTNAATTQKLIILYKNNAEILKITNGFTNQQISSGSSSPPLLFNAGDVLEIYAYPAASETSFEGSGCRWSIVMINTPLGVTGTLPVSSGGTGLTTIGTNGQVLTSDGTSASWANPVTATYGSAVMTNGATVTLPPLADASTATNVLNFTLPSAGTWDISVQMRVAITTSTQNVFYCLCVYDNTSTLVANSEAFFNSTPATAGIGLNSTGYTRIIVTTTGAATYSLRGYQPGGTANIFATSDGVGRTKVIWVKIQ